MSKNCVFLSVMIRLLAALYKGLLARKNPAKQGRQNQASCCVETRLFMLVSLVDVFFKAYLGLMTLKILCIMIFSSCSLRFC